MSVHFSLGQIVDLLGGELSGNHDLIITRVASLANAQSGSISFMTDTKYSVQLANTRASAVILRKSNEGLTNLPHILTDNPYAYFARVSELLNPKVDQLPGVDPSAMIDVTALVPASCSIGANVTIGRNVKLGEQVEIHPGCVIGDNVEIGNQTVLQANVVIYHDCLVGKQCVFSAGVVIGADGFGYAEDDGRWVKIPQVGRVVIQDFVEIGANTTIDRGALDDTVIAEGVKLDNLIQIGHNCVIGAHTVIAGCVGIAGSAKVGKHCKIGGAAMILGHLEIADGVTISSGSMITRSLLKPETYSALMPFQTHSEWLKTAANIRRLSEFSDRIKYLEKQLAKFDLTIDQTKRIERSHD